MNTTPGCVNSAAGYRVPLHQCLRRPCQSLCLSPKTWPSSRQVVVVLSGSMEPAFYRGDILFLHMGRKPLVNGEVQPLNLKVPREQREAYPKTSNVIRPRCMTTWRALKPRASSVVDEATPRVCPSDGAHSICRKPGVAHISGLGLQPDMAQASLFWWQCHHLCLGCFD